MFAEFEANFLKGGQMKGISKAKAEGRCNEKPPKIDKEKVGTLASEGVTHAQIAQEMGCVRRSICNDIAQLDFSKVQQKVPE